MKKTLPGTPQRPGQHPERQGYRRAAVQAVAGGGCGRPASFHCWNHSSPGQTSGARARSSAEECRHGRHEPVGVVEPRIVACSRLHRERGVREHFRELGRRHRRTVQIELSSEQQNASLAGGERRTRDLRAEGALGREQSDSFPVARLAGYVVLLCRGVPPAPEEGGDGFPVAARALSDRLQGGERCREPRLVLPQLCELAPSLSRDRYVDSSGAGADERELADLPPTRSSATRSGAAPERLSLQPELHISHRPHTANLALPSHPSDPNIYVAQPAATHHCTPEQPTNFPTCPPPDPSPSAVHSEETSVRLNSGPSVDCVWFSERFGLHLWLRSQVVNIRSRVQDEGVFGWRTGRWPSVEYSPQTRSSTPGC